MSLEPTDGNIETEEPSDLIHKSNDENIAKYQDFALHAYTTVRQNLSSALLNEEDGLPILVVVGEQHSDIQPELDANEYTPDARQEPALAAAFTEIGALEAAARLVGKDNMALSIELPPHRLSFYVDRIKDGGGVLNDFDRDFPFMHTLAFAVNNNIEIIPTDPGLEHRSDNEELREQMQRDAVSAIAASEDGPRVVVHVGGFHHLSNFAGYTNEEIRQTRGLVTKDDADSPFDGVYGDVLFFNTTRDTPEYLRSMSGHLSPATIGEANYSQNPENATQIDAPGAMCDEVQRNIGEMVRQAAADYSTNMRVPQNDTPDNTSTIKTGF